MVKRSKISVSLKLTPDQKEVFDKQREKYEYTQQRYLLSLVLLDGKFDLINRLGDPVDDKFLDDDFTQFSERVGVIKPLFDALINAEQLQKKVEAILKYLQPPEPQPEEVTVKNADPVEPAVTPDSVEPTGAPVTEGQLDQVQQEAIAAAKPVLPGNPAGLLPGNALNPPVNKHAIYAEIGLGQVNLDKMRTDQFAETRAEMAERKKILEGLGIGGEQK